MTETVPGSWGALYKKLRPMNPVEQEAYLDSIGIPEDRRPDILMDMQETKARFLALREEQERKAFTQTAQFQKIEAAAKRLGGE